MPQDKMITPEIEKLIDKLAQDSVAACKKSGCLMNYEDIWEAPIFDEILEMFQEKVNDLIA